MATNGNANQRTDAHDAPPLTNCNDTPAIIGTPGDISMGTSMGTSSGISTGTSDGISKGTLTGTSDGISMGTTGPARVGTSMRNGSADRRPEQHMLSSAALAVNGPTDRRANPYSQSKAHQHVQEQPLAQQQVSHVPGGIGWDGMTNIGVSQNIDTNMLFQEFIESAIMEHAELVQAARAVNHNMGQIQTFTSLTDWSAAKQVLEFLAYCVDADDPWRLLGIPREEGPLPDQEMIERRTQLGTQFTSLRHTIKWTPSDQVAAEEFEKRLADSKRVCLIDLPRMQREKRNLRHKSVPRWMEPSPELTQFLHDRAVQSRLCHKIGLHLSNLLKTDLSRHGQVMSLSEARTVHEALSKSAAECEQLLRSLGAGSLTLWAPGDSRTMAQLAATFLRLSRQPGATGTLHLVVPHEPYPGCITPAQIMDLWGHDLMSDKWKTIVQQIEFLRQPTRCVFSGSVGPQHHVKSISIFTLAMETQSTMTLTTQWRPTLASADSDLSIIVDCPRETEAATHRALRGISLKGLFGWSGPRRSLGSGRGEERVTFTGHFDATIVSKIELQMGILALRKLPTLMSALIGTGIQFTDSASLLVEMGNPKAVTAAVDSLEQVVLVLPRLALMTTQHRRDYWQRILTEQLEADPTSAISAIRFRKSNGGRPWTTPEALPFQIRGARMNAGESHTTRRGSELQATLSISDATNG